MNAQSIPNRVYSPYALGFTTSVIACTVSALIASYVLWNYIPFPGQTGQTWKLKHLCFVLCFAYSQLIASTLHNMNVTRIGNRISGMIYGEMGDDEVDMTVNEWVRFWFVSTLFFSSAVSVIGIGVIYCFAEASSR